MIVGTSELSHNQSESSRKLHISNVLNKCEMPTIIIGKKSETGDGIVGANVIAVKQISGGFIGSLLLRFQVPLAALRTILSEKVDKVILRGCDLPLLAIFIKIFHKKMIYDFHGYLHKEEVAEGRVVRSKITRIFDSIMLMWADCIIAVSEGTRNQLPKKYLKKTIVLPNGVDLELFKGEISDKEKDKLKERYDIPKDKTIVGFVGNWERWMSVEDMINASMYLDSIQMLIVGKGYNFDELYRDARNNPLVTFTGNVSHFQVVNLFKLMSICVVPYSKIIPHGDTTGYFSSRKTKEYLAAGKPIIMSSIKARESFLDEDENVILYKPEDAKDLASKVKLLLNDEQLYKKMCENNKKLSGEFSWEGVVTESGLVDILRRGE